MDLLLRFFYCFGLATATLHNSQPFRKEDIRLQEVEALLPQLDYFYIPCKAKLYLHPPLTPERCITIAKHILRPYSMSLVAASITIDGIKKTQYHIHTSAPPSGSLDVSFA